MESNINKKNALRNWWAQFPQTYGKEHGKPIYSFQDGKNVSMQLSTPEFFDMVDKAGPGSLYDGQGDFLIFRQYQVFIGPE